MITLITRQELLTTNKRIGSSITEIQKDFYSEEMLQDYKDENQEHLYWEMYDFVNHDVIEQESHSKILSLNHSNIRTFTKKLSQKLEELFLVIGTSEFYVVTFLKCDFFGNRENNYKPLARTYEKLEKIVGKNTYKEAFHFDKSSLFDMVEVLFWISRCDPSVSDFMFLYDKDGQIQMFICKYGNIHLTELGSEKLTEGLLNSHGWTVIDGPEYDNFSQNGKINGRQYRNIY
ncbi:hypothetical protein ACWA1C_20125 [Flectobacillus roseus]